MNDVARARVGSEASPPCGAITIVTCSCVKVNIHLLMDYPELSLDGRRCGNVILQVNLYSV
jgi:hypothetical protein